MKRCAVCDNPIPPTRRSPNVKYCSGKCARKAESQQSMRRIATRTNRINPVAQKVYHAYDHQCAICGWQATPDLISTGGQMQYAHGNEIHHITPMREGGEETSGNLILLCPNHHKQADMGLLSIETLQSYSKPFREPTEEETRAAIFACSDTIAKQIF